MDPSKTAIITRVVTVATANNQVTEIVFPDNVLLRKFWVVTLVAGSTAGRIVRLNNASETVTYGEVNPGTAVAGTLFQSVIPEDRRLIAAGTRIRCNVTESDATSSFCLYVLFAHPL